MTRKCRTGMPLVTLSSERRCVMDTRADIMRRYAFMGAFPFQSEYIPLVTDEERLMVISRRDCYCPFDAYYAVDHIAPSVARPRRRPRKSLVREGFEGRASEGIPGAMEQISEESHICSVAPGMPKTSQGFALDEQAFTNPHRRQQIHQHLCRAGLNLEEPFEIL
jgi:hypothetical protein